MNESTESTRLRRLMRERGLAVERVESRINGFPDMVITGGGLKTVLLETKFGALKQRTPYGLGLEKFQYAFLRDWPGWAGCAICTPDRFWYLAHPQDLRACAGYKEPITLYSFTEVGLASFFAGLLLEPEPSAAKLDLKP